MIIVDERIGSKDLLAPLKQYGIDCDLQHLQFGDVAFTGRGINGASIEIGIELKETRDLISSLHSARFPGHQLPGLQSMYDRVWLVTEGIWRAGEEGVLEVMAGGWRPVSVGKHRITASDLDSWILTQVIRGGIQHHHCGTRKDTIRFISTLYRWWTSCDMEDHRSHQAIYTPPPDRASLVPVTPFRKMIAQLGGIGWDKSIAVEEYFKTPYAMVNADESAWSSIPGIGKKLARKAVQTLRGDPSDER